MVFAHVRGYSVSDAMISTAAVAVGLAVARAFTGLDRWAFIVAIPSGVAAALAALAPLSRVFGRRAAWELRGARLAAVAWVSLLLAETAAVLVCFVRSIL